MDKKAELVKLKNIIFYGAIEEVDFAMMGDEGTWFYGQFINGMPIILGPSENQPVTFLDWSESLIMK